MTDIDLVHAQGAALKASQIASEMLQKRFRTELNVSAKGYVDYVTELDSQCEEAIRQELANFDDTIAFVGEESTEFIVNKDKIEIELPDTCWIVDPLDGTSNYAHGFAGYSVSIALRVNKELKLGIVQAPTLGELYSAIDTQGAYCQHNETEPTKIKVVDNGERFNIFATSMPYRYPEYIDQHIDLLKKFYTVFDDMRRIGSAELDLAWTAKGVFAAFIERFLKPWDSSAGAVILREAGGIITDWSGDDQEWLINGQILSCSSARLHEKLLDLIK